MKIGLVNDSSLAIETLRATLARRPLYRVSWIARDGEEAVALCARDTPDVVLMDLLMPGMDGVEAIRRIMAATPCAVLVVTSDVGARAGMVFEAMGAGALDAVDTPVAERRGAGSGGEALLRKLDRIEAVLGERHASAPAVTRGARARQLVVIGASAGGPEAVATVLRGLPADYAAAVVIVQHVDQQFAPGMAHWLGGKSSLPVHIAQERDEPLAGTVLLAATNDHLVLMPGRKLAYQVEPSELAYRPSVDVFFRSVCSHWPGSVVGVVLTGMGNDGARGLKALRDRGHYTIAQDQASCAVYGMPKAAVQIDAARAVLPLHRIADHLVQRLQFEEE